MFTLAFLKATAERALKTVGQSAAALLIANAVGILETDWLAVASLAGMAGVVSALTSVGSYGFTHDSPSLAGETSR